jgi:hypothetical protein
MRRYVITCEFHQDNATFDKHVRLVDPRCEHPHSSVWVVRSVLVAAELRYNLMAFLTPEDKLFVCEAGIDMAGSTGVAVREAPVAHNVVPFPRRSKSSMLTSVFASSGRTSRMFTGAIAGNSQ